MKEKERKLNKMNQRGEFSTDKINFAHVLEIITICFFPRMF